jgi:hypothetical protein
VAYFTSGTERWRNNDTKAGEARRIPSQARFHEDGGTYPSIFVSSWMV